MNLKSLIFYPLLLFRTLLIAQGTDPNMLDTSTWTIGTGSVVGFGLNGSASENSRELGLSHVGEEVVLWKATPDALNDADGGWNSTYMNIDNTKTYRLSVWIKKTNSTDGVTYFGCQQWASEQVPSTMVLTLNGNYQNNPYFWNGDLPQLDRWYLLVGYVHGNSYSSQVSLGKIYDGTTGEPIVDMADFKFSNSTTNLRHRAYLYYDTTVNDRQYFYAPRMEIVDGTEWTLNQLLSINPDSKLLFAYDNAGNQKQRFYCAVSGCTVPNPPAGRVTPDGTVAAKEIEEDIIEETKVNETNFLEKELTLFPNPTDAIVSLKFNSSSDITLSHDINIYNSAGVLVKTVPSNTKNELKIDFTNLATGMYLVHIHLSNGTSITKQIIKN